MIRIAIMRHSAAITILTTHQLHTASRADSRQKKQMCVVLSVVRVSSIKETLKNTLFQLRLGSYCGTNVHATSYTSNTHCINTSFCFTNDLGKAIIDLDKAIASQKDFYFTISD